MTTTSSDLHAKLQALRLIVEQFDKVAVAYSGGIDSSFLLHMACTWLGADRVLAIHASSCLLPSSAASASRALLADFFAGRCQQHTVHFAPLYWPDFVDNPEDRCYLCKKRLYTQLLGETARRGYPILFDGTNADDQLQHRPGLRALVELAIATPLMTTGLGKREIRALAREAGLPNHDLPSQSCLATRIPTGTTITEAGLARVDRAEEFLRDLGFIGCRVRFTATCALVEIQEAHFGQILTASHRASIVTYFASEQNVPVYLDLRSRR